MSMVNSKFNHSYLLGKGSVKDIEIEPLTLIPYIKLSILLEN